MSGGADSSVFFVSAQWCTLYQTEVADPVFAASVLSYGKISGEAEKSENSENLDASSMSGNYHIYLSEEGWCEKWSPLETTFAGCGHNTVDLRGTSV